MAPIVEESGGDTIFVKPLAIRTPERLRSSPDITHAPRTLPETIPGSIPKTDKVTSIDSACKDEIGAL
jgi:hypothetical protein